MQKMSTPFAAVASVVLAACVTTGAAIPVDAHARVPTTSPEARYTYPESPVVTSGELVPQGDPAVAAKQNYQPVSWPLRFKRHSFSARCYDTLECEVIYDGVRHGQDHPSPSSNQYGPEYLDQWSGSHAGIKNFPPPAKVVWRSKDGSTHEATIDIGELFQDGLIRHYVPREEVSDLPNGVYDISPSILMEVNDRTIRVYQRATVPTRHLQKPGNPYSTSRRDLVLVQAFTLS